MCERLGCKKVIRVQVVQCSPEHFKVTKGVTKLYLFLMFFLVVFLVFTCCNFASSCYCKALCCIWEPNVPSDSSIYCSNQPSCIIFYCLIGTWNTQGCFLSSSKEDITWRSQATAQMPFRKRLTPSFSGGDWNVELVSLCLTQIS